MRNVWIVNVECDNAGTDGSVTEWSAGANTPSAVQVKPISR